MKEYIEREAARDMMEQALADEWEIQYADDRLDEIPAADVVEVRHAEWVDLHGYMTCTVCGFGCDDPYYLGDANYCPNCGAKMDGGINE